MNCIVKDRNRARRVIQQLGERSDVIGTDLVSPAIDPSESWTVEVALDSDGLPPAIVSLFGEDDDSGCGPAAVVVALRGCGLTINLVFEPFHQKIFLPQILDKHRV